MSEARKPIKVIWSGSVQIPVWRNVASDGKEWFSMTIQRNYKDKATGEWNKTGNFSPGDLGDIQSALAEAISIFRVKVKDGGQAEIIPTLGEQKGGDNGEPYPDF